MRFLIVALVATASSLAFASSKILTADPRGEFVIVTRDGATSWNLNDRSCVYRKSRLVGCGTVVGFDATRVKIRFDKPARKIAANQKVDVQRDARQPASVDSASTSTGFTLKRKPMKYDASMGIFAGLNYYYPVVHVQMAVNEKFSLGVMPLYASFSQDTAATATTLATRHELSAFGAYVTANYYFSRFTYHGFYAQGAFGVIFTSVNRTTSVGAVATNTSYTPLAFEASLNYRGSLFHAKYIDAGVGLGFQYITNSAPVGFENDFNGVLPLFHGFLAFSF